LPVWLNGPGGFGRHGLHLQLLQMSAYQRPEGFIVA
jgi:hypothetical protein